VHDEETMTTTALTHFTVARFTASLLAIGILSACSAEQPTQASNARIEVTEESSSSVVGNDPHDITLMVGMGIVYRARIVDANGQPVSYARPTWRSTVPTVASVTPLPDSGGIDAGRAAIAAQAVGNTLVIATYNGISDTSRVNVIARVDSVPQNPASGTFDATILVRGYVAGRDTAGVGSQLLLGSSVTLTRLPSIAGDVLKPGVTPVTVPTVFATLTVDSYSQVIFRNVPQSRFKILVTPPSGTSWQPAEFTVAPPPGSFYGRIVTLQK
jgi:hypothetical protein